MRMETISVKNRSPSLCYKKYTLQISSQHREAIRQSVRYLGLENSQLLGQDISTQIFILHRSGQYFLQITTALERSLVEEALESILSATEGTRRISLSMGNWRKSIVVA